MIRTQKEHPDLSKADAQTYILELRGQNPAGKLSGMSIQDIIKKVGTFIERDRSNRVAAAQGREIIALYLLVSQLTCVSFFTKPFPRLRVCYVCRD